MPRSIRVLLVPADGPPAVREVFDTLAALRELVGGGWLETLRLPGDLWLYCDEEGRLKELPVNRHLSFIRGDCFVGRLVGSELMDITEADVASLSTVFEQVRRNRA